MQPYSPENYPKRRRKVVKSDRFGWVLTISIIFHLVIVLGVSFVLPSQATNQDFAPPLKITLVATQSEQPDEEVKVLAQADSQGEEEASLLPLISNTSQQGSASESTPQEKVLMEQQAEALYNPNNPSEPQVKSEPGQTRDQLTRNIDLAFLNSQSKPRERFVSANTRASEIAPYLENWRLLVERVGNLNYPDAAKRQQIEGELVMDVTLRSDGSVSSVNILKSSGHKVLDDGAERIVHIAAPFDPFSEAMKREYDTLHIIRTWKFSQNKIRDITR
ncbi:MAG: energy transducer TonB [Gammaproteobacteria bacterium]